MHTIDSTPPPPFSLDDISHVMSLCWWMWRKLKKNLVPSQLLPRRPLSLAYSMLNGYVTGLSLVNIGGWVYPMVIINISCIGSSRLTALSLFPIPSSIVQVFSLGIYSSSSFTLVDESRVVHNASSETLPTPPTPNTNTIVSVIVISSPYSFFLIIFSILFLFMCRIWHTHTMNLVQLHSWSCSCSCSFISISSSKPIGSTITWLLYKYRIVETDLLLLLFHHY